MTWFLNNGKSLFVATLFIKNNMNNLEKAKVYGGFGTILALVGAFVPYIGTILMSIGIILVLLAVRFIYKESGNKKIFENCAISVIVFVVWMIIGKVFELAFFSSYQNLSPSTLTDLLVEAIWIWIISWIFLSITAYFLRKSLNGISEYTNVNLFKTAGLLYLIGGVTTVLLIGYVIWLIAAILQMVAFFSISSALIKKETVNTNL